MVCKLWYFHLIYTDRFAFRAWLNHCKQAYSLNMYIYQSGREEILRWFHLLFTLLRGLNKTKHMQLVQRHHKIYRIKCNFNHLFESTALLLILLLLTISWTVVRIMFEINSRAKNEHLNSMYWFVVYVHFNPFPIRIGSRAISCLMAFKWKVTECFRERKIEVT